MQLVFGAILMLMASSASASQVAILRNGFSISHDAREVLGAVTRLYTSVDKSSYIDIPTEQIDHFEVGLAPAVPVAPISTAVSKSAITPPATHDLNDVVRQASDKYFLDADLVDSVIRAESGFNPRAVSPKGARGLMQLMPATASGLGVKDSLDPRANVEGGTQYLRWLLDRYNYDLAKSLAAYNAGPHRVERYRGVPPYAETQAYVARIIRDFNRKKMAERKASALASKKPAPRNTETKRAFAKATGAGAAN